MGDINFGSRTQNHINIYIYIYIYIYVVTYIYIYIYINIYRLYIGILLKTKMPIIIMIRI